MSDHKCIKVTFDINSNLREPRYWKFNTSRLKENQFVNEKEQLIQNFDTNNNPHAEWETLKTKTIVYSINQSKMINKSCKLEIKETENNLSEKDISNVNTIERQLEKQHKELIKKQRVLKYDRAQSG